MLNKVFLALQGLMLTGYGLYCLTNPAMLAGAAGVQAVTTTGTIELQSMYGGLQTAIGVMCLLALIRPTMQGAAMMTLLLVFTGLAVTRVTLGLLQSDFSDYTVFAMVYESLAVAFLLWRFLRGGAALNTDASTVT